MLRLLALTSAVAVTIAGCGHTAERDVSAVMPTASAEMVDGFAPFTRPALDSWVAHEIATTFEKENAAAKPGAEHPSF